MFGDNLKYLRQNKNLTQQKLADVLGISRSAIGMYESGEREPDFETLEAIADFFNVRFDELIGERKNYVIPVDMENIYMRPIYDSAAAGFNVLAQDTIIGYMPTCIKSPSEQDKYIWVNVVGDSMSPLIDDGSRVLLKKQDSVDNGQIAVVLIDDEEAVVKKVYYGKNWIELQSINPYYPPRRFEGSEVQQVQIIGLVKEVSKTL
ncbi:MAG: helix-turn-helix domain-containing protein [Ruminococcus sp.]|nr:helix-turn-helix domain-containing protein [Ruminococcus sp.]